jgi:hypothetical protein
MENSFDNFIEYKIITQSNIAIFFFDVKKDLPTPFQWTCAKEDFKQRMDELKKMNKKYVYLFDVRIMGMLTIAQVKEFVAILEVYSMFLESSLITSVVVAEGVIIKSVYEVIKLFYKTKKPLKIVKTMELANIIIDEANQTSV